MVSCPCAFALAVPAAITRALTVLARCGVLVVKPDAIAALAQATDVVFDKTGTLTMPHLAGVQTFNDVSPEERCVSLQRSRAKVIISLARAIALHAAKPRFLLPRK